MRVINPAKPKAFIIRMYYVPFTLANLVLASDWNDREFRRPLDVRFTDYYETNWLNIPVLTMGWKSFDKIESILKSGTSIRMTIEPETPPKRPTTNHHHTILLTFALLVFPAVLILGIIVYSKS